MSVEPPPQRSYEEPSSDLRPSRDVAPEKTRLDLDWARLLAALAERCETALGKDLARDLTPADDVFETHRVIAEVGEAIATAQQSEPLPIPVLPDVRDAYERALHGGVLSPVELRAIVEVLGAARTLRRFLHARRDSLPTLFDACSTDPALDRVEDEIARAFDPEGTLSDKASPKLRTLRSEYATSRARMISRIEELMRRYSAIIQDSYWTEREGRYVLPVRSDAHERFPGIVHASSNSGATLFVEPRVLVPMGNRLKMLEGEVKREEEAIYAELTGRIVESIASVDGAITALGRADLRAGAAKLARDLALVFPEIPPADESTVFAADLRTLRHPLLALEAFESRGDKRVVPSDIKVASGRALIVSGPNAGGKTVALKALGLASLMFRAGLPVPVGEGSRLGMIEVVLTDVGDDQSLQKNLSTFSAHVTNLARILDDARPGALVLLDELAGGTDPREGEALAAAVLDGLCRRGAAVVATTHYEGLKALAMADPRFTNASVGFDHETLTPTFRLALGIPGASSALAVARRFGVPSLVIERAETYLSGEDRSFEQTVKALHGERRALELARAAVEAEQHEARAVRQRLEQELAELRARDRRIVAQEAEALLQAVRRAREDVRQAQLRVRQKKLDPQSLGSAEKAVDSVAGKFAIGGDFEDLLDQAPRPDRGQPVVEATPLRRGAKVYLPKLRAEAEVIEVQGDGQLRVAAGALKVTVPRDDVRVLIDGPRADASRGASARDRSGRPPRLQSSHHARALGAVRTPTPQVEGQDDVVFQTTDNTCDVRGLRVDDAWPMVEQYLDRALNEGQRHVFIVHGHGSGALRDKIRDELKASRYVARFRSGKTQEGGEGVTIAWLR